MCYYLILVVCYQLWLLRAGLAGRIVGQLRERNVPFRFLTNNSQRTGRPRQPYRYGELPGQWQ